MKLELFYQSYCPFCKIVLNKINELGLGPFIELKSTIESEHANYHYKTTQRNTVPCLYIDNTPMFESSEIVNWLKINADSIKG